MPLYLSQVLHLSHQHKFRGWKVRKKNRHEMNKQRQAPGQAREELIGEQGEGGARMNATKCSARNKDNAEGYFLAAQGLLR